MGWEKRKHGGAYYYRSVRLDDRIERRYFGSGAAAMVIARAEQLMRKERQRRRAWEQRQQDDHEQLMSLLDRYFDDSDSLIRAVIVAAGFRQHDRGPWRMRHGQGRR